MRQITDIAAERNVAYDDLSPLTVFRELLGSKLPGEEKNIERLTEDAVTLVTAGSETVSWTLSVTTYHLLTDPRVLRNLKAELRTAIPDLTLRPSLTALENLPYLTGVIKEGLRLSYGFSSRLPRVSHEPLVFLVPAGTPVSMSIPLIHQDESIFQNRKEFKPELWIEDPRLDRFLISFSKGSRNCVGLHVAYAEQYLCCLVFSEGSELRTYTLRTTKVFLELFETDASDVNMAADRFVPHVKAESKGVKFRVSSMRYSDN